MQYICLENPVSFRNLTEEYALTSHQLVNIQIGYDEAVYFLFRGNGGDYRALCLYVDWTDGTVLHGKVFYLGAHETDFYFVQPIGENLLLVGARCCMFPDGTSEKNALIVSREGEVLYQCCFGDGIEGCVVTSDGRIITSYFDEGVFGNLGWRHPIGSCGIIVWDRDGNILWKNEKYDICDCYALTVDDRENLWFYYYTDFDLVKTDFKKDTVYRTGVRGSSHFLFTEDGRFVLFDGGYDNHTAFKGAQIQKDALRALFSVDIVADGKPVVPKKMAFRGSRAVFVNNHGVLYMKKIIFQKI